MTHQLHEFSELRQKDIFCDAVIRVDEGTEFSVHRIILCACSDYFLALFRNNGNTAAEMPNNKNNCYHVRGIRAPAMTLVLDYIYDTKCMIDDTNMLELLVVGDYLSVLGLVAYCEEFIMSVINVENCVSLMRFGKYREYLRIYEAAKLFILSDFMNIIAKKGPAMMDLSGDLFQELIQDDRLRVKQEDFVWECCTNWIMHKPDRAQYLLPLMLACRLALISQQCFNERVREHPMVKNNTACKSIIKDVLKLREGFEDITTIHPSRIKLAVPRIPHEVIMAIGGWGQGSPQSRIETFDIRADRWNLIPCDDPFGPRAYHGMVAIRDKIYCIGGFNGDEYFSACRVFDVTRKIWSDIAPMHSRRCYVSVVELEGQIYALGGYDGHARLSTCEKFDPTTNQWRPVRPMNCHRSDANACVMNGRIYITGGFNGQECLNSVEYFDPVQDMWHMVRQMSIRRSGVSCASHMGKIYVMGGFNGLARLKLCEKYDPETNEWTAMQDMSFPRSNFAVEVIDDIIFAIGGFNGIQTVAEVESYDPLTDVWNRVAGMNVVRSALRACVIWGIPNLNDYIYPNRLELVTSRHQDRRGERSGDSDDTDTE